MSAVGAVLLTWVSRCAVVLEVLTLLWLLATVACMKFGRSRIMATLCGVRLTVSDPVVVPSVVPDTWQLQQLFELPLATEFTWSAISVSPVLGVRPGSSSVVSCSGESVPTLNRVWTWVVVLWLRLLTVLCLSSLVPRTVRLSAALVSCVVSLLMLLLAVRLTFGLRWILVSAGSCDFGPW